MHSPSNIQVRNSAPLHFCKGMTERANRGQEPVDACDESRKRTPKGLNAHPCRIREMQAGDKIEPLPTHHLRTLDSGVGFCVNPADTQTGMAPGSSKIGAVTLYQRPSSGALSPRTHPKHPRRGAEGLRRPDVAFGYQTPVHSRSARWQVFRMRDSCCPVRPGRAWSHA